MTKADKEGQRKAPILRFKGFTDAWEQRKLKELGNIKRGASPRPISDPKWFDENGKYGWLRISDVTSQNGQVFQIDQHLSSIGEEKTVLISSPHLIISIAATVGKPCINYIPTAIHDGFVAFLDYKFNLDFMFEWFNKNQNIWLKYGQPGAQINLNSSIIGNQKIKIPEENEQEKIAKLFNILNNLLALYERKTKLIKQIQSSFLEQFFSEANNVTSLNHFLKIRNGYAFKSSELTENGEMPVVKISNIGNDKPFAFTTETKNKEQFTLYPNDIVIALSGATAGKINQVSNKYPIYYQNQRVGFFERKNDKLDYEYLNSFLHSKKFKSQLQKTLVAGAQPNIAPGDIEKIKIPFLEYELQQAIGQVNKDLFRLQNLNKRKLTVLNKIKTTLLNTMFI